MLYPDLSLITTSQNATQNAQYAAANAGGGPPGAVVSVSGAINTTPIVAPAYPGAYHNAITAGGHQVRFKLGWAGLGLAGLSWAWLDRARLSWVDKVR
jgi:hypothetical protein